MGVASPAVVLCVAAGAGAFVGLTTTLAFSGLLVLAVLSCGAAIVARGAVPRAGLLVCASFAIAVTAGAWARNAGNTARADLPTTVVVVEGVVEDVRHSAGGHQTIELSASGVIVDGQAQTATWTLQIFVPPQVKHFASPGDTIRVRGRLRPLLPAFGPGEIDGRQFGLARGIAARLSIGSASDIAVMDRATRPAVFARLRLALRDRMLALLPPRLAGLELALLVGDTSLLDDEQRAIYRRVGAGHLLAVSGLQVTLLAVLFRRLAAAVILATPWGRRGRGLAFASWLALLGVVAFVLLCGAPPSAVRAAGMACAVLVAEQFDRRVRLADALGIAALFTILLAPTSVFDPSFVLSYGAVWGLVVSSAPSGGHSDGDRGLVGRGLSIIVASVGAGLLTLPLSASLFGEVALAGLVANIILVPLASALQVPALGLGLVGAMLGSAPVAWLGAQAALFLEAVAAGFGDVLPGVRPVTSPGAGLTVVLLLFASVCAAALARRRMVWCALAALGAGVVVTIAAHEPHGVRITVLPVGQGDGTVIEMPDGSVMLIDAGGTWDGRVDPGNDTVLPFLMRRGISVIDVMVLSHPHPDHALGLMSVARSVAVRELWHNGSSATGPLLRGVLDAASGAVVRTTPELLGKDSRLWGGATVEVLAPAPQEGTSLYPELGANDNSLVLRVCFEGSCALWPGDIEALGEELLLASEKDVGAQVVKVPHHGSRTSSTPDFIRRVGAGHAIFCTGPGNTFSFPHRDVLERWRAAGARLWNTATHGELIVRLTAAGVSVEPFAEGEVQSPEDG